MESGLRGTELLAWMNTLFGICLGGRSGESSWKRLQGTQRGSVRMRSSRSPEKLRLLWKAFAGDEQGGS